ncbi:hypothetical protein V5420_001665 [Listeria monocytogenes]
MKKIEAVLKSGENYLLLPQEILFKKDIPVEVDEEVAKLLMEVEQFTVTGFDLKEVQNETVEELKKNSKK